MTAADYEPQADWLADWVTEETPISAGWILRKWLMSVSFWQAIRAAAMQGEIIKI